jgi:hypothetical protein
MEPEDDLVMSKHVAQVSILKDKNASQLANTNLLTYIWGKFRNEK